MDRNLIAEVSTSLNILEFEWIEGDFAELAVSIEDLIIEFREIGVDLPWKKLLNKKVNYEIYTFTDLIDCIDGVEIESEQFDYGMMRSGFHYEFYYEKDKLFQKSLKCLNELKISILNILNEDKNQLKKLIRENNDLKETNKKIKILQDEIKQFKIERKESKNKTDSNKKLNESLVEVIQFLSDEKKKYLVIDSLLFDKKGNLFSIINFKLKSDISKDLVQFFNFLNLVEVIESARVGGSLWQGFLNGGYAYYSQSWEETKTLLKADGFDIMKIREEYINNK